MERFRKNIRFICGLILFAGLFSSCGKEYKVTVYQLICDTSEFTQPQTIKDPEVQSAYTQFLFDIGKLGINETWQVEVVNDKFKKEDDKAEAKYNSHLPEVKELESTYKKMIEGFGTRSESSFYAKVVYKLSKSVPADYSTERLQEYSFELKYD